MSSPIIGVDGRPLRTAYDAGDPGIDGLYSWQSPLRSPDVEILPQWEGMVGRQRELIRNNGLASGAIQTHLDSTIGTGFKMVCDIDWKALGVKPSDETEEFEAQVQARFRSFANDPDCYIDVERQSTLDGLLAKGYRSYLTSTELLASFEWKQRRADRAFTCVKLISPDRMENPDHMPDSFTLRRGVELDRDGAAIAYHIRNAHRSESGMVGAPQFSWKRVPAFKPWGRRNIVHLFDGEVGQTRGKPSFVSVLSEMKMFQGFKKAALQNAVINAMYAAVLESNLDAASASEVLGAPPAGSSESALARYMKMQSAYHRNADIRFDGSKVMHTVPGEKFTLLTPKGATVGFDQFEASTLRYIAAGLNMSYEALSRDYSKTNYSSARASMLEAYKFIVSRRHFIGARFAQFIYTCWFEEELERGFLILPKSAANAPSFYEATAAWTRATWIGQPREHIDEEKRANALKTMYELGGITKQKICAEQGEDFEDVAEQLAREEAVENKARARYGLPPLPPRGSNGNGQTAPAGKPQASLSELQDAA